ncbi:hypothetical protein [Ruania zhangjianzhongii]|uniref:hypothetical protein n=1 Tax=Ruania zhangjianzhongii TaxID=2603206 RepID=UPI0011C7ED1B|nr:hypothetical protein [Ruania zhangjianzhongii]
MSEDAIVPLMRAIVAGIDEEAVGWNDPLPEDWQSFSVVIDLTREGTYANSYGYAYGLADAWIKPVSVPPALVDDPLNAFVAERYPEGATPPVKMLFQLELATGNYNVEYEDSDRARWKVSPANYQAVQAELKPVFED